MDAYDAKCDAEDKAKKRRRGKGKRKKKSPRTTRKELAADKAKEDAAAKDAENDDGQKERQPRKRKKKKEEEKKARTPRALTLMTCAKKRIADLQSALSSVRSKMPKPTADARIMPTWRRSRKPTPIASIPRIA